MNWRDYLSSFRPEPGHLAPAEGLRSVIAAVAGVSATIALSAWLLATPPAVVAAVGASAVLVFALPASPLAQPWAVVGGYLVCALSGVLAAHSGLSVPLAGALAVGLALAGMLAARCLHPPGGAVALFAVIGGPAVAELGFRYVFTPVLVNAVLLIGLALAVNNLVPGRHYPRPHVHPPKPAGPVRCPDHEDLIAALEEYGRPLYISEEELEEILRLAARKAAARKA